MNFCRQFTIQPIGVRIHACLMLSDLVGRYSIKSVWDCSCVNKRIETYVDFQASYRMLNEKFLDEC